MMDGPPRPGQMSYPFMLQVPDWLPASMMLGGGADYTNAMLSIEYYLKAQFVPTNNKDWVHQGLSSFRGTRTVYLYRPSIQTPQVNIRIDSTTEVGNFLCCSGSESVSQVMYSKNQFYLGEKAMVRIICDNTNCGKDVKNFKFKLLRYHGAYDNGGHNHNEKVDYLFTMKYPGCAAGEKVDRTFELDIPTEDKLVNHGLKAKMHPDQHPMFHSFSTSFQGKLISVNYVLKLFVKHKSWNEIGEGRVISQPIKIMQPPMTVVSSQ